MNIPLYFFFLFTSQVLDVMLKSRADATAKSYMRGTCELLRSFWTGLKVGGAVIPPFYFYFIKNC